MTKVNGVLANDKTVLDAEQIRDLTVSYFETMQELAQAQRADKVDCGLVLRAATINNTVFSRGMIGEEHFLENLIVLTESRVPSSEQAKFGQTMEVIGAMAEDAIFTHNTNAHLGLWPDRYTHLFNPASLQ